MFLSTEYYRTFITRNIEKYGLENTTKYLQPNASCFLICYITPIVKKHNLFYQRIPTVLNFSNFHNLNISTQYAGYLGAISKFRHGKNGTMFLRQVDTIEKHKTFLQFVPGPKYFS